VQRIPEQELMSDPEQARVYAEADFEEPHSNFIRLFQKQFGRLQDGGFVLDAGCGPGDITFRFARAYPSCTVHGVDGSEAMLDCGRGMLAALPDIRERVLLFQGILPGVTLPCSRYDSIISNSLLHHLPDPGILWDTVKHFAAPGAPVFIMDLKRPASAAEAQRLTRTYAAEEPEVLQKDFYQSLLASFEVEEIQEQLRRAGLAYLDIAQVSDRHVIIAGRFRPAL